jgi:uncharacterized protein YjiS (DUF1127 family)
MTSSRTKTSGSQATIRPITPANTTPEIAGATPMRVLTVSQSWLALVSVARLVEMLMDWRDRARQRRQLAAMDHHMLRDIGLSLADVEQETQKPFWRI